MLDFLNRIAARCIHPVHCFYFGAVAIEGHGYYASAAAVLLVLSAIEALRDLLP